MRATKPWVQALGLDPQQFSAWSMEVPKNESITFWCLEKGHLRSKDYFEWAKNFYGLASINTDYFKQPANRDLWLKIHTVANWSPELLPVEEWDGVVFVACVEPPEDIQWSFPVQYLLATASDLKSHWERLNAEPTKVSMPAIDLKSFNLGATAPTAPEAAPTPATAPVAPPPKVAPPLINLANPAPAATPAATPPVAAAPVINLAPAPEPAAPASEPPVAAAPASEPPVAAAPPTTAEPTAEGSLKVDFQLNLGGATSSESASTSDAPTGLSLNLAELEKSSDAPEGLEGLSFNQDEVQTGVNIAPLDDSVSPLPPPPVQASDMPNDEKTGFTLIKNEKINEGSVDADALAPAKFDGAKSENEKIAWIFQQMKQHFKYSWVMYIRNDQLVPWKWEKSANPTSSDATQPIDLHQPSLFRVVFRTKMPYHGPVISNLINTSFFKNWSIKTTPNHVTAAPIVVDGVLVALLIGAGATPEKSDEVLRFAEKLTPNVIQTILKNAAA